MNITRENKLIINRILPLTIALVLLPLIVLGHEGHKHQSETSKILPDVEFRFLSIGETAPDFTLMDQDRKEISLKDFSGKAVLLTFIYTNCPGSCPITIRKFVQVQKDMADTVGEELMLLAITVDPEVDTPEILKDYAVKKGVDLKSMYLLTGSPEVVKKVLKDYGIWSIKDDEGYIDHPAMAYMIDDFGMVGELLYGFAQEPIASP